MENYCSKYNLSLINYIVYTSIMKLINILRSK